MSDFTRDFMLILTRICFFLKGFYVGKVYINHQETAQIAASGFLKKGQETGQIPGCSFYLPAFMSRDATVVQPSRKEQFRAVWAMISWIEPSLSRRVVIRVNQRI